MNVMKIQELQYELNTMIDNDDDYSKIYKTSVELDLLIVEYYNEVLKDNRSNRKVFRPSPNSPDDFMIRRKNKIL